MDNSEGRKTPTQIGPSGILETDGEQEEWSDREIRIALGEEEPSSRPTTPNSNLIAPISHDPNNPRI